MLYKDTDRITLEYEQNLNDQHGTLLCRVLQDGQLINRFVLVLFVEENVETEVANKIKELKKNNFGCENDVALDTIVLHNGHNDAEQFCLSNKNSRKWESDNRIWEQINFIALKQLHHANNVYFSEQKFNASELQVLKHIYENE